MKDASGRLDRVLVLGGDSDIGAATVDRLVDRRGAGSVVLAGRSVDALERRAAGWRDRGVDVTCLAWDATEVERHDDVLAPAFAEDVDVVVLAAGQLGDQATLEADPAALAAFITTNFTGCATAAAVVADRLRRQGHGALVVLSTIAATQARRANFAYGSTKAGLDAFALGLGDALDGTGARVVVVRPGFVRSAMTEGMQAAPFACDPADVAAVVDTALDRPHAVAYAPGPVRFVSWLLRLLPRALVRRLPR